MKYIVSTGSPLCDVIQEKTGAVELDVRGCKFPAGEHIVAFANDTPSLNKQTVLKKLLTYTIRLEGEVSKMVMSSGILVIAYIVTRNTYQNFLKMEHFTDRNP